LGQGALAFSEGQRLLFAVNAGSNTISVFQTGNNGLQLLETVSSLGIAPISITAHDDVVYVLNSGGVSNIAGFRWDWTAGLQPIAGSVHGLSQASPSAVQVGFDPKGDALVVTEKATNMIDVFPVDDTGLAGSINSFVSAGNTPFGFAFALYGTLVVSNANGGINNASSASTYKVLQQQSLETLSSAVPTNQTAACWAAVTHNGRFAYVADAGSSALTGYSLRLPGTLSLLNANGRTASTDPHPIDMAVSFDDRFLYVVSNNGGAIDEFAIKSDGTLWPLGSITGLPTSISGAVTD
jgi:6-phosphogluconolactonase (cycloisomerase 2 family)